MYQANAELCRQQAALRSDPSEKQRCLVLAEQWTKLAETAKKQRPRKRYVPRVARARRPAERAAASL